jgi:hypothetical protein
VVDSEDSHLEGSEVQLVLVVSLADPHFRSLVVDLVVRGQAPSDRRIQTTSLSEYYFDYHDRTD